MRFSGTGQRETGAILAQHRGWIRGCRGAQSNGGTAGLRKTCGLDLCRSASKPYKLRGMNKPPMTPLTAPPTMASGRVFNFSPGPATLPEPVLRQVQEDVWDFRGTGIGILEHSHRGAAFDEVFETTEASCRRLAGSGGTSSSAAEPLGDDWCVLFLQGGATQQFASVPMSFLAPNRVADYLDTGSWTTKAIAHAKAYGDVHLAFEGKASRYDHTPDADEITASDDPAYTWYCSNNTIVGTYFPSPPASVAPLVCDASSDIFSRPLVTDGHGMILAGAQKNLGPAGCTLVIARRDFLASARDGLPPIFDYRKLDAKGSRMNTPPTFAIHVMGLVFAWIEAQGGLVEMAARNRDKAALLYEAIEASGGFFSCHARLGVRSPMNVTFRSPSAEIDARFVAAAADAGLAGLKGHRSVGGLRASIYNAFPAEGCQALADFMADFAQRHG